MSEWRDRLLSLAHSLPPISDSADSDTQARSVLRHLLDRHEFDSAASAIPINEADCPNCGSPTLSITTPYCSAHCREESAFVRQFRAGIRSGTAFEPEKQANFGQNLWHLLGGGYPRRVALIKPRELAKTLARGCELCGAKAVTVDHTGSG